MACACACRRPAEPRDARGVPRQRLARRPPARPRLARSRTSASERYTHLFHTYPAALHADAARDLLALFPGASVLDPFCGGGTVLVEARAAGSARSAATCRRSRCRWRTRCAAPDEATLSALRSRARALAARARSAAARGPLPDEPVLRAVQTWYAEHALRELESLRRESPSPTLRCAACSRRSSPRSS
jgi:hypothetical protein